MASAMLSLCSVLFDRLHFRLPSAAAELKGLRRESSLHNPQHPQPFQTLCALLPITAVSPSLQLLQEQNPTDISRAVNPTAAELLFPSCCLPGTCLLQKNCLRLEWIESELFFFKYTGPWDFSFL